MKALAGLIVGAILCARVRERGLMSLVAPSCELNIILFLGVLGCELSNLTFPFCYCDLKGTLSGLGHLYSFSMCDTYCESRSLWVVILHCMMFCGVAWLSSW